MKYALLPPLLVAFAATVACTGGRNPTRAEIEIARGIAALEADDYVTAVSAFTAAAAFDNRRCEPPYGLGLARILKSMAILREFNQSLFGEFAADPEDLAPLQAAEDASLVEDLIVSPLLLPLEAALTDFLRHANTAANTPCRLAVHLPLKLAFGSTLNIYLQAGPEWTEREMMLLYSGLSAILALNRMLLAHDLEVPPLTALKLANRIDTRNTVALLRSLGVLFDEAPTFLEFHADAQRRQYFDTITGLVADGLQQLAKIALVARSYMDALSEQTGAEVLTIEDRDGNGYLSPGDNLVLNIHGKIKIGLNTPIDIDSISLRVGGAVQREVVDQAVSFLQLAAQTFAGEVTAGTRLKLSQVNGIFQLFGQDRLFEDVLELDPVAFFRGPLQATWTRRDSNGNCAEPEGADARCTCAASRVVTDPETGEAAELSVIPDLVDVIDGAPTEVCLRELLEPIAGTYPDTPQPLRSFLPYWYKDPFLAEDQVILGVEGEVSDNLLPGIYVPPYVAFGDFFHFLFGDVATDQGTINLLLSADCVAPPSDDQLGLVTIPYIAWREPTFNGALFVNLGLLTGGSCQDSQTADYRIWNPPDLYAINKITAHYYARYGRLIYDVFTFLDR